MAKIEITIPDNLISRVLDGYCGGMMYADNILVDGQLVSNPETKSKYANRMLRQHIRSVVLQYESANDDSLSL